MKDLKDDLARSRLKNFKAAVKHEHNETRLVITHNGYQFTGIALNHREMEIVIELLTKELEGK